MSPEDIDDLFRAQLDGHATPPGDALWARLQADAHAEPATNQPAAATERLDQLFQKGLNGHATPPGRALWERLEDEHLRPRQRRAAAWWPMALAAAVALLLVAGGAGLWLGFPSSNTQTVTLTSSFNHGQKAVGGTRQNSIPATNSEGAPAARATAGAPHEKPNAATVATLSGNENLETRRQKRFLTARTTRPVALASTAPKANRAALGQSARHPLGTKRQPDAAADHRPLVARSTAHHSAHPALHLPPPAVADESRPAINPNAALALAPKPAPTPEIGPASPLPAPDLASRTNELIMVDVRNGATPAARPHRTFGTALAEADAPNERRGLGGRLLLQAGHLVRGERLSLVEATGLPETVTVRATIAGRSVSKSIQL